MHGPQPTHRILDLGPERHAQQADAAAARSARVGVADRDRRDRDEARPGQLVVREEVAPERAAADGKHRVVDRRARHELADALELVDREAARLEHAVRRDLAVEARDRQAIRVQPHFAQRADDGGRHLAQHAGERRGNHERLHHVVECGTREQRDRTRRRGREPRLRRLRRRRLRCRVVQERRDLGAALHVDRGVVDLGEDREAVRRKVEECIETLDEVQLPERAREVERSRVDARCLDAELAPVAGLRQRDVAHVVLEVEALVLDPVRVVELERHPQQLLAEDRREVQAALDVLQEPLEPDVPAGCRGWVVDVDERDVRVGVSAFGVDETGVFTAQLAHGVLSARSDGGSARV